MTNNKNDFMTLLKRRKRKMMIFASKVIYCLWEKYLEINYFIEFFKDFFDLFCYWCHCQIQIIFLLFYSHHFYWEQDSRSHFPVFPCFSVRFSLSSQWYSSIFFWRWPNILPSIIKTDIFFIVTLLLQNSKMFTSIMNWSNNIGIKYDFPLYNSSIYIDWFSHSEVFFSI
jgi:hypothetical protein